MTAPKPKHLHERRGRPEGSPNKLQNAHDLRLLEAMADLALPVFGLSARAAAHKVLALKSDDPTCEANANRLRRKWKQDYMRLWRDHWHKHFVRDAKAPWIFWRRPK